MCQSNEHFEHVISKSLVFLFAHEITSNLHEKNRTLKVGLPSMPRFHRYLLFVPKDTIVMNNIETIVILNSQVGITDSNDGTLHHSKITKVTAIITLSHESGMPHVQGLTFRCFDIRNSTFFFISELYNFKELSYFKRRLLTVGFS